MGTWLESVKPETCYLACDWTCTLWTQCESGFLVLHEDYRASPAYPSDKGLNEDEHGALVEWYRHGKIGVLGQKPVPVSLRLPHTSQRPVRGRTRDIAVWHPGWSLKFIERIIKVQFLSHRDQTKPPLQTGSITAVLGNNWVILKNRLKHAITLSVEGRGFHYR